MVLAQPIRVARPPATCDAVDELSHGVLGQSADSAAAIAMMQPGSSRSASGKSSSRSMPITAAIARRDHAGSRTARHPMSAAATDTAAIACPRSCWQ